MTSVTRSLVRASQGLQVETTDRYATRPLTAGRWSRVLLGVTLLIAGACSDDRDDQVASAVIYHDHAVGITQRMFVDTSRGTVAHSTVPASPERVLETTIVYPAQGPSGGEPVAGAPVEAFAAPYPLLVLSHGLGGSVDNLLPLAETLASRGYVVAVPRFPLTNSTTPGGPLGEDVQNQPADVSYVIDQVLLESADSGQLLGESVDPMRIAAGGHSNGAITTYGLVAHSCCRDRRIGAALILAGVASPFAGGEYDLADTPPTMVVHGINDQLVNYNQSVRTTNELSPPRGFLSFDTADHGSFLNPAGAAFAVLAPAAADFFDGALRGVGFRWDGLVEYTRPGVSAMYWAADEASSTPVPELPEPETNRQAFLSADTNLVDGQVITVSWTGFLPDETVNVLQCNGDLSSAAAGCDIGRAQLFQPSPGGVGSAELTVYTGAIGNGVCDSDNPCFVTVNDAALTDEDAILRLPITFAD
ncbi:MAG: neocarzinostatin apoprotein domain-containing protein [Halioglobus sp.]|nr:neocarzinostatin apoprotein domain-containing protein [Halioglobus sp.]